MRSIESDMQRHDAARAPEYDRVDQKPERQADDWGLRFTLAAS